MNRRQFAVLLPAAALSLGCNTEQRSAASAGPININDERVQNAIKNLGVAIGDLEEDVVGLQHGDWGKFVPKVETAAADIRIAYEHLRQSLGLPTA